ncbi:transmembrane protein [Sinorhizobium meliloti CCNWSX0020]|uniref:Lectin-like protein BA14k n=1 Tax=Sinorhizobium meliloti CCNWSX0020 TaxID=1107881 RepID=H0G8Y9_RHIML|nr:BA14K family protein [Sinorhizobium meliloti]EHK74244.1 transmembrane protein [Sinorhizobium meliloti CCNWSX0020]RVG70827.1 BA14K family protein [Sinorhizobium meliloti]RVH39010.1 BA14K family protein [Sinorhizobium meliloti]
MKRLAIVILSLVTALTSAPPAMAIDDDWAWALGGLATGAVIGGLLAHPRYYGPSYYDQGYYDQGYYNPGYYDPGYYAPTYYRQHYYAVPTYRPRYHAPRYYRQAYYGGSAHTRWCYARYRSYWAYDNTFQPYHGPRRACVSPYY